jgi:asparagine synthase (glutamine-hydrolysing)
MCGLAGVVSASTLRQIDIQWTRQAIDTLTHRGPDDSGYWISQDATMALGHQRLAVVDLSIGGHQPMESEDSQIQLVFNGEIYNYMDLKSELIALGHAFRSRSDSEVIVNSYKQWGSECVKRLNGQFAFVIIDRLKQIALLARDRAGEKPLYYANLNPETIAFASELKALALHPSVKKNISSEDLSYFLLNGYFESTKTMISSVLRLPPAHILTINMATNSQELTRYWSLPNLQENKKDLPQLCNELEELLTVAISRQYQADVPVGILLSGGLDSSIIATLAARKNSEVRTFTAVFPESKELDESMHAKLISDSIASKHIELEIHKPSLDLIEFLASNFDEPILDPSLIPTFLISREIRKHCTVALGGDGADEIFGGYRHLSRLLKIRKLQRFVPETLSREIGKLGQTLIPFGVPGNALLRAFATRMTETQPQYERMFDVKNANKIFRDFLSSDTQNIEQVPLKSSESEFLDSLLRQDFMNFLPNDILVKLDRYSMLNSLEIRAPFLDVDVVEFAFREVPARYKVQGEKRKILLTELGKQVLPKSFQHGRKMGFIPPVIQWGKTNEWQEFMKEILFSPKQILFDKSVLADYFEISDQRPLLIERLLTLSMFEIWRSKNF